ncbi:GatB/YqeY domain-containing protein [Chitinophagales bacterium]|nr:GatB/YqeY domain-containing protein [Chitinophagales bacterium]|tara:strand:- start:8501 stop:8950 length:450 start_codon:yes stop_codon:yes gene_type:complete
MSLEVKIQIALKEAMKAKDAAGLRTLRAVKTAISMQKTERGASETLSTEQEAKILQKMVKQRNDALSIYQKENRNDLAEKEQEEIAVLKKFLPKQLSIEELEDILRSMVDTSGLNSKKDMGRLMGMANIKLAGVSDGKTIASVLKNLLQ